jgi:hypothetical protein
MTTGNGIWIGLQFLGSILDAAGILALHLEEFFVRHCGRAPLQGMSHAPGRLSRLACLKSGSLIVDFE